MDTHAKLLNMESMITQTKVLARQGWSKTLLLNLLGDPDLQKKVFGRSNLSCLYLMERVVSAHRKVVP